MSDELCHYWVGLSKEQFGELYLELPGIENIRHNKLALAAYLIKLRTGDSDQRISTLLNVPRTTLMRLMGQARDILEQVFVPNNLGISHISRTQISERNLLIPNGLFGGENRQPIIISDGTYLYVQKSSNYMYQKDTYSLHKYRNLMKPLLMVCCDGYIIDVLGPYPATTSDANIIIKEFNEESKPLRRYFQADDVFILDRGFRDSVPLLRACNYKTHMPASLQQGENQLSTLAANKSRAVTVCRWVVEAVNGIFKQSYKLLRHEFFNRASKHAMTDFRIAAALINRFHQRIRDREDAGQILEIINHQNMHINNTLADFVNQNNLNRRRTDFLSIDVNIHNVSFPRLEYSDLILIACGTYQLKQARSYYGEHIRGDGSYTIELCRNTASNLLEGFPLPSVNCSLLRGKIQSRHISRKTYFVYILYESNTEGRAAIKQYCCNCMVGRRTVGCCAHIMTIIWFLSWARYQEHVNPPAQFLDNVLITYESE
ncbi:hypothetical protein PYW07_013534 [Mythimna separata]|uniref:DDE Tnp4 domain-containing protein n=1 Tax=Mythimna separata TaxID=271217 RepID=A0AAD7YAW6_MYTSE|nr:hypothetical protein PYW07_013534 [Mythimna separata]